MSATCLASSGMRSIPMLQHRWEPSDKLCHVEDVQNSNHFSLKARFLLLLFNYYYYSVFSFQKKKQNLLEQIT